MLSPPDSEPLGSVREPEKSNRDSLLWRLSGVVLTLRPHQWVKNVFVLAPIVFAKEIFYAPLLLRATAAFFVFCLLAGAVYTMNDLADVEADRQHPIKCRRPIASGRVPLAWARILAVSLVVVALGSGLSMGAYFASAAAVYYLLNFAYSKRLKHVAYLDVLCIAVGFVLRVLAGGLATGIAISNYLLVCTALLALFLGFGKRRHELATGAGAKKQRRALQAYRLRGLDWSLALTGFAAVSVYLAYTLDPHTRQLFRTDWLWTSTLLVVAGVARFLYLVRSRPRAESPTQEMLRDGPFVAIMMSWVVAVVWVVYHLQPGG